jgi:ribosomal protein S13
MLLRVRKILEGGDLSCFRPSTAEGERKAVGLALLIGNGIGPARSESILEKFNLTLQAKNPDTYLSDCKGIGPKLAFIIQESFDLPPDMTMRPKARKAGR